MKVGTILYDPKSNALWEVVQDGFGNDTIAFLTNPSLRVKLSDYHIGGNGLKVIPKVFETWGKVGETGKGSLWVVKAVSLEHNPAVLIGNQLNPGGAFLSLADFMRDYRLVKPVAPAPVLTAEQMAYWKSEAELTLDE